MPTYDYECEQCGHTFERFQKMSDEPEKVCPECKGPVRRLIGKGAGVIFKGGQADSSDSTRCGRESPCCGKDIPCDKRPCD